MRMTDHYTQLGVKRDASEAEIKKAYRKLAKELHPDRTKNNAQATERFSAVTDAYDILTDKEKRAQYDRREIDEQGERRDADPIVEEELWEPSFSYLNAHVWSLDWEARRARIAELCAEHPHLVQFFADIDEPPVFTRPPPAPPPPPPPPPSPSSDLLSPLPPQTPWLKIVGGLIGLWLLLSIGSCVAEGIRIFLAGPQGLNRPASSPQASAGNFTVQPFSSLQAYTIAPSPGVRQVNVRSGPGSGYSLVVQVPVGYELIGNGSAVASDGSIWISVTLPRDGWSGFVAERLLRPTASAAQSAAQPSFACVGDLNYVENMICGDASLAAKDREVADLYGRILRSRPNSGARDTQRGWLEARNRCGGSGDIAACLHSEYDSRIAAMRNWLSAPAPIEFSTRVSPPTSSVRRPNELQRPSGARSQSQRFSPGPTIICILPSGRETQLTSEQCRQSSGVVYRYDEN